MLSRRAALSEPMLDPEREARLILAWKESQDPQAWEAISRAYARLCYKIASRFTSNEAHIDDLAQEGFFGLRRAMDKFDPSFGIRFSTYCRFWVQNFIAARASTVLGVITVPSRAFIDARRGRLEPGRNDAAVAAAMPSVDLDARTGLDGDATSLLDRLACPRPNPEQMADSAVSQESFEELISAALQRLSERERTVLVARRLSDPPRTLEEISRDFGLTRERIRQIEVAGLAKLKAGLIEAGFDPEDHFRD